MEEKRGEEKRVEERRREEEEEGERRSLASILTTIFAAVLASLTSQISIFCFQTDLKQLFSVSSGGLTQRLYDIIDDVITQTHDEAAGPSFSQQTPSPVFGSVRKI